MHEQGYIIIDTEGTGLFTYKNEDGTTRPSDAPGQPRMAQFAAVLADKDLNVQSAFDFYIKPQGWQNADGSPMLEMPAEAFAIHGIPMDHLYELGVLPETALSIYQQAIRDGRAVLGWNQQHDGRQVRAELRHAGLDDMFEHTLTCCAMRSCTAAKIKIPKANGKRGWAGLADAAAYFGIDYPTDRRHRADEDAMVTCQIARILNAEGKLLLPEVHYAKDKPFAQEVES